MDNRNRPYFSRPTFNSPKFMNAKFPGVCIKCGVHFDEGTPIAYANGRASHQNCPVRHAAAPQATVAHPQPSQHDQSTIHDQPSVIRDGTYTVVFDAQDGSPKSRRTLMISTRKTGNLAGRRIVSVFTGSDNTSKNDYTPFGFLNGNTLQIWQTYRNLHPQAKCDGLAALALEVLADPAKAGLAFAMESGCCYACRRTLTVPISIHAGLGPECAKQRGITRAKVTQAMVQPLVFG